MQRPSAAPPLAALAAFSLAAAMPALRPEGEARHLGGDIVVELDAAKAPKTVDNFLQYVKDDHYDGTVFHRVIDDFMIQGGGFTADLKESPPARRSARKPQRPEERSTARSRWRAPTIRIRPPRSSSSTSRTTTSSNQAQARDGNGYAVFGKVISGMDVVDKIKAVPHRAQRRRRAGHSPSPSRRPPVEKCRT